MLRTDLSLVEDEMRGPRKEKTSLKEQLAANTDHSSYRLGKWHQTNQDTQLAEAELFQL